MQSTFHIGRNKIVTAGSENMAVYCRVTETTVVKNSIPVV